MGKPVISICEPQALPFQAPLSEAGWLWDARTHYHHVRFPRWCFWLHYRHCPPRSSPVIRELQRKAINIQDSGTGQLTDTRESKRQQVKLQMFSLYMWTSHKCLSVCLLWCVTVFKIQRQAETSMRHWKRKINPNKLRKWSPEGYYFG